MLMRSPFVRFLVRWLVCSLGLWIAAGLLSRSVSYSNDTAVIIIAGLILAIINTILKPIVVILSLPWFIHDCHQWFYRLSGESALFFVPCDKFRRRYTCRNGDWAGKLLSDNYFGK
jgi:hypothetical protein